MNRTPEELTLAGRVFLRPQCSGPVLHGFGYELETNTQWVAARWATRRCQHHWQRVRFGVDLEDSALACGRCGVYRWWPVIRFGRADTK